MVWSNLAPYSKSGITVQGILNGWERKSEAPTNGKTEMDISRERYFAELREKNGGTATDSQVPS